MGKFIDLTGQRFGRWTVIREYGRQNGHVTWLCECDCGNTSVVCTGDLRQGKSTSCGCFHNEMVANITKSHEMAGTRLYSIWSNMIQRCTNMNRSDYKRYGGRGITVCDEWKDSFQAFNDWAVSNGYADDLTLDRIDSNGNYEPQNCRWATYKEQGNNKRSNRLLTYNGETHTIAEWADIVGIKSSIIYQRINCYKWSVERALTQEVRKR